MENGLLENRKKDNAAVAQLIRAVFDELNIQKWYCLCRSLSGLNVRRI
jgi:hypothetical protein